MSGRSRPRHPFRLGLGQALALQCVAIAAGCATQIPHPSSVELEVAHSRWPQATVADLELGRTLYVQNCAGCHELVLPRDLSAEAWIGTVEQMRVEAEVELSDEEATRIQQYLFAASQAKR